MKITSFVLQKTSDDTRTVEERIRAHRKSVSEIGLNNTLAKEVQDGSLREYKTEHREKLAETT